MRNYVMPAAQVHMQSSVVNRTPIATPMYVLPMNMRDFNQSNMSSINNLTQTMRHFGITIRREQLEAVIRLITFPGTLTSAIDHVASSFPSDVWNAVTFEQFQHLMVVKPDQLLSLITRNIDVEVKFNTSSVMQTCARSARSLMNLMHVVNTYNTTNANLTTSQRL